MFNLKNIEQIMMKSYNFYRLLKFGLNSKTVSWSWGLIS